jgi:hypothetical protein
MHRCWLCNEQITSYDIESEEAFVVRGEYWHAECFAEYYGEVLETA